MVKKLTEEQRKERQDLQQARLKASKANQRPSTDAMRRAGLDKTRMTKSSNRHRARATVKDPGDLNSGHEDGYIDPGSDGKRVIDAAYNGPKCGAKKTNKSSSGAGECRMAAGWGTNHPGEGPCKLHGGSTPNTILSVDQARIRERLARIFGGPISNVGPHEALLMEVQRTAGHIEWLNEMIQLLGRSKEEQELILTPELKAALTQHTENGMQPSVWINMYQEERKHLVRASQAAISGGVAERQVRIAEDQGKLVAMVIRAIFNDTQLALTPAQKAVAPLVARNHLLALSPGTTHNATADYTGQEERLAEDEDITDAELL